jgi:hypothetical protein
VNFEDAVLVRLADPATRAVTIDADALELVARAAYDVDALSVQAPFTAVFEEFRLGVSADPPATLDGRWSRAGSGDHTELRLRLSGLGLASARVDALWRGAVVARGVPLTGTITGADVAWLDTAGIDSQIVADLGALPGDPAELEAERRSRWLARVRTVVSQPAAVTEDVLDRWLVRLGAESVSELVAAGGGGPVAGTVRLQFSAQDAELATVALPVTVLVLVRGAEGLSVASLLAESNSLRERLDALGLERPSATALPRRRAVVVLWVVPASVFDDNDWPGGNGPDPAAKRAARRAAAGAWLADEGVALATVEGS